MRLTAFSGSFRPCRLCNGFAMAPPVLRLTRETVIAKYDCHSPWNGNTFAQSHANWLRSCFPNGSTRHPHQVQALKKAGCKRIFEENASGGRWDRPELHRALEQLRPGDVFVVWKLDRLSRSLKDLLHILERITENGARLTLQEQRSWLSWTSSSIRSELGAAAIARRTSAS